MSDEINYQQIKDEILKNDWISYRYDNKGKMIGWISSLQDDDGHIVLQSYDDDGNLIEISHIRKFISEDINTSLREIENNKIYNKNFLIYSNKKK